MSAAVDFDFGALPPEVNSALMYAGPGPQSLTAGAAAWADLARELESAAGVCAEVSSELTGSDWHGPAAASMAAAAAPYTSWMHTTASHAAQAADQATAAVNAYETAYAATVPPAAVTANRAQLASLTASNLLGQNSPAIAATEAQYGEMWAQDAAAMHGYAAQSATAATLPPLNTPPRVTTDTGLTQQAAATTHATAAAAGTTGSTSGNIFAAGSGSSTTGLAGLLNLMSGSVKTPFSNFINSGFISNEFFAGYVLFPGLFMNNIGDFTSLGTLFGRAIAPGLAVSSTAAQTGSITPTLGGLGTLVGQHALGAEVSAGVGKSALVGSLSAPRSWINATSPGGIRLATAVSNPPGSMPSIAIGPMGLPTTMPAASRADSGSAPHHAPVPRYGFRLTVLPPAPTGDSTARKG